MSSSVRAAYFMGQETQVYQSARVDLYHYTLNGVRVWVLNAERDVSETHLKEALNMIPEGAKKNKAEDRFDEKGTTVWYWEEIASAAA